jgi:phosphocarrier protein HPr
MAQCEVTIKHPTGLHARPAAIFVQAAKGFASVIKVAIGGRQADAKSIMGIMSLGIESEETILISAEGPDADQAVEKLKSIIDSNFAEG